MARVARSFYELDLWERSFSLSMEVFELTKSFPRSETYALTDQVRRSSRAIAANVAEAWEKRRYEAAFIAKLTDAAAETAETQNWLRFAERCGYCTEERRVELERAYDLLMKTIHSMALHASSWCK